MEQNSHMRKHPILGNVGQKGRRSNEDGLVLNSNIGEGISTQEIVTNVLLFIKSRYMQRVHSLPIP